MHGDKLNYALHEFIDPEYVEMEDSEYLLTEEQDSGHTELRLRIQGENLCIAQYDKKNRCGFWNRNQRNGLSKCVDHAILQHTENGWLLHLIEMKGRMDNRKEKPLRVRRGFGMAARFSSVEGVALEFFDEFAEFGRETVHGTLEARQEVERHDDGEADGRDGRQEILFHLASSSQMEPDGAGVGIANGKNGRAGW
mgnify:CR=1 FL=1